MAELRIKSLVTPGATPAESSQVRYEWRNEWKPEMKAEGDSLCTFEIETVPDVSPQAVKLSITHSMERPGSKFIEAVSGGWPRILSNLKSLLETGEIALKSNKSAA